MNITNENKTAHKKSILNFNANEWAVDKPVARPFRPAPPVTNQQAFKPIAVNVPPVSASKVSVPSISSINTIPQPMNNKPKSKSKVLIAVVAVILAVVIGIGVYVYNNLLCPECHSDFIDKNNMCSSCYDNNVQDCGDFATHGLHCYNSDGEAISVCSSCYINDVCDECNTYFPDIDLLKDGEKLYCPECSPSVIGICYSCEELIRTDDPYEIDFEGDYFHEDCYNDFYGN
ncbi:MAG: hypothetical protein E7536_01650 [Ruminococcaceae bacterium]|nr:hypothetical protein [Oscillospiraceae bacterium]